MVDQRIFLFSLCFAIRVLAWSYEVIAHNNANTNKFIEDFLRFEGKSAPPSLATAFICWERGATLQLIRHMSSSYLLINAHSVDETHVLSQYRKEKKDLYRTFILDLHCNDTDRLLAKANELDMLRKNNRWLLLKENDTDIEFDGLSILLDSDVTMATRVSNSKFDLHEVYRHSDLEKIIIKKIGQWEESRGVQLETTPVIARRRMNLHQSVIKAVTVVNNNASLKYLDSGEESHIDTYSKACHAQFKHVVTIVNASVEMTYKNTWGHNVNGSWTGLIGYLQQYEGDIGATGSYMVKKRLSAVDYIAAPTPTRAAFLFRPPPLSFVTNIFKLPFSSSVWILSAALIGAIGVLLYSAFGWEYSNTLNPEHVKDQEAVYDKTEDEKEVKPSWSDVALMSIGAVCQQGSTFETRGLSGRMIMLLLFITVIFLYTSYSACIVALLQSTADSIRTLEDLYDSGLKLGALDGIHDRRYFAAASDPIRKAIFQERVNPPGGPENFLTIQEGLKRVRQGLFAFHHEVGVGYKIVSDTFLEEEKCGLQTLSYLFEFVDPHITVSKNTSFKEVFSIAYRMVHESGLQVRENFRFYHRKPKCDGMVSMFLPVGMVDFYPALLVLVYGVPFSIVVMVLEILVDRKLKHSRTSLQFSFKRRLRLFNKRMNDKDLN